MRRHKGDTGTFSRRRSLSDPLAAALRPPENETPEQRETRLNEEQEAKRVSDGIDEMIRAEKKERRVKQEVKVLLLGQSESGKSTTLKRESDLYFYIGVVFCVFFLNVGYDRAACYGAALALGLTSSGILTIGNAYSFTLAFQLNAVSSPNVSRTLPSKLLIMIALN